MFCRECGAQVEPGARFCGACGGIVTGQPSGQANQFATVSPRDNGQSVEKANHRKIGMIACGVVLLIVIVGAIVLFSSGGNRDRHLIGTWESTDMWIESQLEFRRNGSGVETWWESEFVFTWRTDRDGRLWKQYDEGDEWWVYYEIVGDMLRLTTEWNELLEYRKVE